jgi:PAS domain S-box-containing protein
MATETQKSIHKFSLGTDEDGGAYLQILNAMPDMILVKSAGSKIVWANEAFTRYYGMSNEELLGMVDAEFNEPDYTAQYVKDDAKVFETGEAIDIPEEPVTRHDGEVKIFHSVKSPIFDRAGNVILSVGISRDITEKLKMREVLELERARSVQSSKMALLGELSAGVAHEVNTPLAIIHGYTGQILDLLKDHDFDREFVITSLRRIESTVMRISRIVKGLSKFARDTGKDAPEKSSVTQIIEDALSFTKEKIAYHGIQFELDLPPPELTLECNSTLLSQVILNLLTNARDAVVGRDEKWIRISVTENEKSIEISVTDSGPGIPPENRDKIFAPFFTTKSVGAGTGLGLSVSRNTIEKHGGKIFLDEASEKTRFVVELPKTAG